MALSISNKEVLSYVAETTWGTTPATPTFLQLRYVSDSFSSNTTSVKSAEIINAREVSDYIRTKAMGQGSFNLEMSYGNFDDIIAAVLGSNGWSTNVAKVGTTRTSFTIERGFPDISQYELYTGAIPNNFKLNVAVGKIIDGSVGFVSKVPTVSGTTAASALTAPETNSVMEPIDNIQLVQEGGAGSVSGVLGFTMDIQNNIVEFPQLSNINPADLENGQLVVTGTIDIYWQDATYLTKYLNWTTTSLQFSIGGTSTLKYDFLLSKVKLSQAVTANPGMNQPLVTKFNYSAFIDATNSTLKVTRHP